MTSNASKIVHQKKTANTKSNNSSTCVTSSTAASCSQKSNSTLQNSEKFMLNDEKDIVEESIALHRKRSQTQTTQYTTYVRPQAKKIAIDATQRLTFPNQHLLPLTPIESAIITVTPPTPTLTLVRQKLKWSQLPLLALGRIFDYLEPDDRINASLVCQQWRSVLFQRRFFNNFKFKLHVGNDRQLKFFNYTICHLITNLDIIFDFFNCFHVEKLKRVLYRVSRCENFQGLRFQTNNVGLAPPGEYNKGDLVDIEDTIIEPLKQFLRRKKSPCKILDLGGIESLTYHGIDILSSVERPQDIEILTLASIKFDPSNYPILCLENSFWLKCKSLQILSLDYDTISDELLSAIQMLPLKKFLICVHGLDREQPDLSEAAWENFSLQFKNLELIVTLIYAYEAVEVLQVRILRQNMPITHLRVLFCDFMNIEALDWISVNSYNTLKSIQWIDSAHKHNEKNSMELFARTNPDPFVMMSWRCKNLEEIVIHGYAIDLHNILGISHLRGKTLKKLEVSLLDKSQSGKNMDPYIEEINALLGKKWHPTSPHNLHPALGYVQVCDDIRDDYVFKLLRNDMYR